MLPFQEIENHPLASDHGLTVPVPGFILEKLGNNQRFRSPADNSRFCR